MPARPRSSRQPWRLAPRWERASLRPRAPTSKCHCDTAGRPRRRGRRVTEQGEALNHLDAAQGVSKWLRRGLIRRVEGLGLPVTAIVPKAAKLSVRTRCCSREPPALASATSARQARAAPRAAVPKSVAAKAVERPPGVWELDSCSDAIVSNSPGLTLVVVPGGVASSERDDRNRADAVVSTMSTRRLPWTRGRRQRRCWPCACFRRERACLSVDLDGPRVCSKVKRRPPLGPWVDGRPDSLSAEKRGAWPCATNGCDSPVAHAPKRSSVGGPAEVCCALRLGGLGVVVVEVEFVEA